MRKKGNAGLVKPGHLHRSGRGPGRPKIYDGGRTLPNTAITGGMEKRIDRFRRSCPDRNTTISDALRILVEKGLDAADTEKGRK